MESTIELDERYESALNEKIFPADLLAALNYYAGKIKVLSLDCFDTLLWRRTVTPIDVFYKLQQKPAFKSIGLNALLRARLESQARNLKVIQDKISEVNLHDIYQAGYPALSAAQLNDLAESELEVEMDVCYAFPPMLSLMREAHSRGIKIIIVSNTYFKENELRRLLAHRLPSDIINIIDHIFCSCEYGLSKTNGLYAKVLDKLSCTAENVLHIGDDINADFKAAKKYGIKSLQLLHHDNNVNDLQRLYAASAAIFNPANRHTQPMLTPFRAILASTPIDTPEKIVGYASIGPIMYSFAQFILNEVETLKNQGKNPKILFLMRDAYLPSVICETLAARPIGKKIRISRFAAFAATFRTRDDIDQYLAEVLFSGRFRDIARQLLLPQEIIEPLVQVTEQSESPLAEFIDLIHREDIQNIILKLSSAYRQRLIRYLENEIDLKPGDTLLFVDLGYSGTAQRKLEPVFREELGVEILGRYLIELDIPAWESSRRGLLDPSWCDDRAMLSLVSYIAILEQICTANEKSVVDYDQQGRPIYSESGFEKNQYEKLDKIQKECIHFIKDAKAFFDQTGHLPLTVLREAAMAELGRFIFLPTENEVNYLESFQFDLNLGTHDVLQVFNPAEGLTSLRKRGLFFSFMEKNKKTMRTNYPAELRSAGLELVMTLMAQHRFGIDLRFKDMSLRRESIQVVALNGDDSSTATVEALLTYDGYYSLTVPISNHGFHTGILLGKKYRWIQFESAEIITINSFLKKTESLYAEDCWQSLVFNDMTHKGGKLYECETTLSSVVIPALKKLNNKNYLVRLVFRPIVLQSAS
ncbi:HAD family hydrolase [Aquicella lusitana]|uniref:Haloacid dehalogenase-like hydrolase n=1 Tax=Aquicella lusitana TaxID=254246 RepID=A0A370G841_9COXI|nr:HAD family hydrolase [Aquicella lusitana]RDI39948.1 haloacid dehalogenase-like hydrolase [Aquicella lusitana]VVC74551.1 hypothetical protein AQULUS_23170 [Aquicella lusitana]